MATVLAIVFAITTVFCAFWWFINLLVANAFVKYMRAKGYQPPSEAEMKECIASVYKEKLRKLTHR